EKSRGEITVDIYNTQSWPRTDVVYLSKEQSAVGDRVTDQQGRSVPSQRLSTGELAVLIQNVPPMSAKRFLVMKGSPHKRGSVKAERNILESSLIAVSVNEQTGAVESLRWKPNDVDLVDRTRGSGLNEYLYVPGRIPQDARRLANVRVRVKEKGSLLSSLLVEADAPGCRRYSYEVRVIDGIGRVDIINEIDKKAVREKEGVHIAFPFNVAGGQLRYDVANGIVRPEADQLPGSCKNFFSVQSWVDISSDSYGVTWSTIDAPLIEIGSITAEQPWMKTIEPSSTFYSYVMNNYWHTNYKADQEGLTLFRYSIMPHGAFSAEKAVRFAKEQREPLVVAAADPAKTPVRSLFHLDSIELVVLSVKPIEGGKSWLVHLYNPTDRDQYTVMMWNRSVPVTRHESDLFGRIGEPIEWTIKVAAFGNAFVRVDRR
ncbi:MAG: glycoside hydrolase family 38 C-terminal domain-containing protein, partial [Bacteroidota bacterium]